jgi:hypothetical protein
LQPSWSLCSTSISTSSTSPKHIRSASTPKGAKTEHDELKNVTARVISLTAASPKGEGCDPQGPRRPRFSFFRFNCQTARPSNGQIPKRETQQGPKTRKTLPDPAKLDKARHRQVRRTPRNFRKRKFREAKSASTAKAAPLPMRTIYGPTHPHVNRRRRFLA